MNLLPFTRSEFQLSNTEKGHPFHYFYFSTFGEYPETRMVVNRGITPEMEITFFSDSRTPKIDQIIENPKVSAVFYHPKKQLQVRVYGTATLLTRRDEGYEGYYNQVVSNADWTKDYTTRDIPGVPKKDEGTLIYGRAIHLYVVKIQPVKLDIVLLGETQHHRSKCEMVEGIWTETEVVP